MKKLLLMVYKSFVRPNFGYADIIYDKPFNEAFKNKLETVQHCDALVIAGAFKGISYDRLGKQLGSESLAGKR